MLRGEDNSILDAIRMPAERAPEAAAICAANRSPLCYGGLIGEIERVADLLKAGGVVPGARIAVVLPNGPEMAVAFLGIAGAAVCAPLNPAYSASEFQFYLSDLNPTALIVQGGTSSAAIAVAEEHGIPVIELLPRLEGAAGTFTLRADEQPLTSDRGSPRAGDVALTLHTSGTTSRAKLVPL